MKESAIQKQIMDYLAVKGILAFRMNIGAMKLEKRFLRFGVPGMADILAFPPFHRGFWTTRVAWIEVKAEKGQQSELQKSFQAQVESHGHQYVLARSIDDLEGIF